MIIIAKLSSNFYSLCFRKGRVLFLSILALSFALPLYSQTFSLKDVLTLGNTQNETRSAREQTRLKFKKLQIEDSRLQHEVRSTLSGARNEVEDTQDLSVSASTTQLLNLSYKQQFQNGFYWNVSGVHRQEQPLYSGQEEQKFDKITLASGMPLYGKSTEQGAFREEQSMFTLSLENQQFQQKQLQLEITTAQAFLELFLRHESWVEAQKHLKLMEQKRQQKSKIPNQQTALDQTQLQFEFVKLQQEVQKQKDALENAQQQLLWLLQLTPESPSSAMILKATPSLENPLPKAYTLASLTSLYQKNSPQLMQLKQKLKIKMRSQQLSVLATHPDVAVSGFVGQSQSTSSTGSNLGVNLSMNYKFGGGVSYEEQIAQQEVLQLQDDIKTEEEKIRLQAFADIQKQQESQSKLLFAQKNMELALLKLKITQNLFKVGKAPLDAQINASIQYLKSQTAIQIANAGLWSQYLNMVQNAQISLLENLP